MVQVIETSDPRSKLSDMLGLSLGQGIGNGLNTFFANRSLESVLQDKALEGAPQSKKLEALRSALSPYGEKGQEILKQRMQIDQQEQMENTRNNLSKAFGFIQKNQEIPEKILEGLPQEVQLKLGDFTRSNRVADGLYKTMVDAGVPEEIAKNQADIVRSSEKGTGQTYAIQGANDLINRFREVPESEPFAQNVDSGRFSQLNPEFQFPLPEKVQGLTLKERAALKKENTQQNLKYYNENIADKRAFEEDKYSFDKMMKLNPHISSGIKKWNINPKTGDIILPAFATPEERQFSKLIVRQLRNAKNTFGAKVSNFESEVFLEAFPGLADNPEAREAILKDLQLVNRLNLLHADALDEVYRIYKPGEISPIQAKQIAAHMIRKDVGKIMDEYVKVPGKDAIGEQPKKNSKRSLEEHFKR
jgi:hypothetical protein